MIPSPATSTWSCSLRRHCPLPLHHTPPLPSQATSTLSCSLRRQCPHPQHHAPAKGMISSSTTSTLSCSLRRHCPLLYIALRQSDDLSHHLYMVLQSPETLPFSSTLYSCKGVDLLSQHLYMVLQSLETLLSSYTSYSRKGMIPSPATSTVHGLAVSGDTAVVLDIALPQWMIPSSTTSTLSCSLRRHCPLPLHHTPAKG
jgi:hypothetical protein